MKKAKLLLIVYLCYTSQVYASLMCSIDIFGLCDSTRKVVNSADGAVKILNEGIQKFDRGQRDWQGILMDVSRKLEETGEQTLSNVVLGISTQISHAGVETRCTIDFLRDRVREDLIRLKGILTGETPTLKPQICTPSPLTVNFMLVKNGQQNMIEIDGYNLDVNKIKVMLVDNQGGESDVSLFLANPSPYLITLNLSHNGVHLSPDSRMLIFKSLNEVNTTINILQPPKKELDVYLQSLTIPNSREVVYFIPPKVGQGDADFHKRIDITVEVQLRISNDKNKIEARLYMYAYEGRHDWTEAEGYSNWEEVYRTESGWELTRIISPLFERLQYLDQTCCDADLYRGKELVELWTILGDTDGSEAGTRTGVSVSFRPIRVELQRKS